MFVRPRGSWLSGLALIGFAVVMPGCSKGPPEPKVAPATRGQPPAVDGPMGRLPKDVVPSRYALDLRIQPSDQRFGGVAQIDAELRRAVSRIWMHGRNLDVRAATLVLADGRELVASYNQVTEAGLVRLDLGELVEPQSITLRFEYDAFFQEKDLVGLYRIAEGGKWYAFTQFEPTAARSCFPGFDEPALKTPYAVTLEVDATDTAAANAPLVREEPLSNGRKRVVFAETKRLPTYLVAFAVGPFDVVRGPPIGATPLRDTAIPLRGLAASGKGDKLAYALQRTGRMVQILEEYLGMAYPYAKLDVVAVPEFLWGAMENPGLMTFREYLLLLDDKGAPAAQKRSFAHVMVHELAHQWFGNLVTLRWWDDLWLNEALASWFEFPAMQEYDASYHALLTQMREALWVMSLDGRTTARQIRQPIESDHDIHNAFDGITYIKGAAVVAMFEQFMGKQRYRKGVQNYLRTYAGGHADYRQFLAAVSEGSGVDVTQAFETFLNQPGVPFLRVEPECAGRQARLKIHQSRFLPLGSKGDTDRTWTIPVCVRYGVNGGVYEECTLVDKQEQRMPLQQPGCPDWVLPNRGGYGYYRWALPAHDMRKLQAAASSLNTRDVLTMADSLDAAVDTGAMPVGEALALSEFFARHPERLVSEYPMRLLRWAHKRLVPKEQQPRVEEFARKLYGGLAAGFDLGDLDTSDTEESLFRQQIVSFVAMTGLDPSLRADLAQRAHAYLGYGTDGRINVRAIAPDLVFTAVTVAAEDANEAFVRFLLDRLQTETDATIRAQILRGLASVKDPVLAGRLRNLSVTDDRFRPTEVGQVLGGQMAERALREDAWDWMTGNIEALLNRIPREGSGALPWLAAGFCQQDAATRAREFFAPRVEHMPGGPRNLAGSLEAIDLCAARVKAHAQSAQMFFAKQAL